MNGLIIVLVVIFVIITMLIVVSGICLIKKDEKRNRNLRALFFSYDKPKQNRISMLKNDLMDNNEFVDELEALELAIELEKNGWRKEVKINSVEVYL